MRFYIALFVLILLSAIVPVQAVETIDGEPAEHQFMQLGGSALAIRGNSRSDAEVAFNNGIASFLALHNLKLNIKVFSNTQELYQAFDQGIVDGIFGTGLEVLGIREQMHEPMMAVQFKNTSLKQRLLLIAHQSLGAQSILELKNKQLTLPRYEDLESLYLNTQLLKLGQSEIEQFFQRTTNAKNANIALMNVFLKRTDVTMVREKEFQTAVKLNPQMGKQLKIITQSPPYIIVLGGSKKGLETRSGFENIIGHLENMTDSNEGGRFLSFINAERLVPVSFDELDNMQLLLDQYDALKKKRK